MLTTVVAGAGARQHTGFVGGCSLGGFGMFRARRHAEQLARPGDIGGAISFANAVAVDVAGQLAYGVNNLAAAV